LAPEHVDDDRHAAGSGGFGHGAQPVPADRADRVRRAEQQHVAGAHRGEVNVG